MALQTLAKIIFPTTCACCGADAAAILCLDCEQRVRWLDREVCSRCGAPRSDGNCRSCRGRAFAFNRAVCAGVYDGPLRDALMTFKLRGERRAAVTLASWLRHAASQLDEPDVICWVPATVRAERERGFNPAREIAAAFARGTRVTARHLLTKTRDTPDQTALDAEGRAAALAGAFAPAGPIPARVLLVDDILTTGATANACATALKLAGARRVDLLVVARAI